MREHERQQSWRRTRRQLHKSMSRHGRKWIKEVWDAAARTAVQLERLSPVTTVLGNRLVESYSARECLEGEDIQGALRVAVLTGYTCRMVIANPTGQPALRPAAFNLSSKATAEALASDDAGLNKLLDPVRTIASERFDSVMALPPEVWRAYVATATHKLQRQFTGRSSSKLKWQELGRERIEKMLRYGYVLCCLDEAIGAEPTVRERDAEPAAEPDAVHAAEPAPATDE